MKGKARPNGNRIYEPEPKDIRRECELIQATWSPREKAKRDSQPKTRHWTPPGVKMSDIAQSVDEHDSEVARIENED